MNKDERKVIQSQYAKKMMDYLPTLRSAANVTQNQLAKNSE